MKKLKVHTKRSDTLPQKTLPETPSLLESSRYLYNLCLSLCNRRNIYIYIYIYIHIYTYIWLPAVAVILDHTTLLGMAHPTMPLIGYNLQVMHMCNSHQRLNRGVMSHSVAKTRVFKTQCAIGCCSNASMRKIMCFLKN